MSIHDTHYRFIGRDYGWPGRVPLVVDVWVPHGQDLPKAWFEQVEYIPEFERRIAVQRGLPMRQRPVHPSR